MRKLSQGARSGEQVREAARLLGLEELLDRKPRAALGRPAPARRDGPRDRPRAAGVPDGRAALEPRREAARADARRDRSAPAAARRHDGLRDPRPGRGDDAGRPRRGAAATACSSRSARRSELYEQPANLFVAGFIGSPAMNLLGRGYLADAAVVIGRYRTCRSRDEVTAWLGHRRGEEVVVGLRTGGLRRAPGPVATEGANTFPGRSPSPSSSARRRSPSFEFRAWTSSRTAPIVLPASLRPSASSLEGTTDVRPESSIELAVRADRVRALRLRDWRVVAASTRRHTVGVRTRIKMSFPVVGSRRGNSRWRGRLGGSHGFGRSGRAGV